MFDRPLVFLDLETTGATATSDRITEIGLIEVDEGRFTGEWSTLVNPQTRIPPFIESLTGISNDMVADAPTFGEVAGDLKARLDGKLLIAASQAAMDVREGDAIRTVSAGLAVYRIGSDGKLTFLHKLDVDTSGGTHFWSGLLTMA
jgi:hypothetical protein